MLITGTDIETTGLEKGDHRIIEFYAGLWDWDGRGTPKLLNKLDLRIHPQRSIQIEAQRIHHISLSDLDGCPVWSDVAPRIRAFLDRADLIVAHNGKFFDLPFLNYEFERVGLEPIDKPLVDTMLEGRWATPQGKVPNLGELCFATDVAYDTSKAHAADFDVAVMMQAFFRAVEWGFIALPSPALEPA